MASRVLMISTNRELAPQPVLPVGAAWVAEALHQARFTVKFLDLCFEKQPERMVNEAIDSFNPDGIGISIRNLDNCDYLSPRSFLPSLKEVTDHIKLRTDAHILLGGSGVSVMPVEVLEYLDLGYAVAGEGETAAVKFFQSCLTGESRHIPGLVCRGKVFDNVCGSAASGSVMPRLHRWIDTGRYLRLEPVIPIQGKRGCANNCVYCTYNKIEGKRWRTRDPAEVAEEIWAIMADTGAGEFEFVDSVFNQPEGYAEKLLEELIRRRIKARLHVSSLSPKGITTEQVRLMERAGVVSSVITPESASDEVLAALCKGFTREDVDSAADVLTESSIKALWCFLVGGPQEDEGTLATTISFINRCLTPKDHVFFTTGIRIYPDTGLHETAKQEGVVEPDENLLMPTFYFTPRLTLQQTMDMLHNDIGHPGRCIFLSDTSLTPVSTFRRIGAALKLPTPFWRYSGAMNRLMPRRRTGTLREW